MGGSHSTSFGIHCLTQTWGETTATWNSQSNYNGTAETTFFYSTSGTPGWYEIDLTDTVRRWVAGTVDNNGIRIRGGMAGGRNCDIDSREATNPAQLVVDQTIVSEGNYIVFLPIVTSFVIITHLRERKTE